MKLSIVATLYCSEPYVLEFCARAGAAAAQAVGDSYEIVLVNDGSPDGSLQAAVRVAQRDRHVTVVDLSRNFGHHKAMMTGLAQARGDLVFLIDSDLEEAPEWLLPFREQLHRERCDVVYGVQERRKGGWFERWSGRLYYRLLTALSGLEIPQDMVTARLMTRRYVAALLRHEEREIDIGGLWVVTGFDQRPRTVVKRHASPTTYTFARKLQLLGNSVTAFSSAPLVGIFWVGLALLLCAMSYAAYASLLWLVADRPVSGWTSVIVSIWLLGGLIVSFIGVVGIYVAKLFSEVKRRPYTIIRDIYANGSVTPLQEDADPLRPEMGRARRDAARRGLERRGEPAPAFRATGQDHPRAGDLHDQ